MDGEVDRIRKLLLSDLTQTKKKFHGQKVTTVIVESQEQLVHIRTLLGASFGAGARCAPKLSDGVLPVKSHSTINVGCPPKFQISCKDKDVEEKEKE